MYQNVAKIGKRVMKFGQSAPIIDQKMPNCSKKCDKFWPKGDQNMKKTLI
jgi:hypothetical protein